MGLSPIELVCPSCGWRLPTNETFVPAHPAPNGDDCRGQSQVPQDFIEWMARRGKGGPAIDGLNGG